MGAVVKISNFTFYMAANSIALEVKKSMSRNLILMKKIASRLGVELAGCLSASGSPAQVGLKTPRKT